MSCAGGWFSAANVRPPPPVTVEAVTGLERRNRRLQRRVENIDRAHRPKMTMATPGVRVTHSRACRLTAVARLQRRSGAISSRATTASVRSANPGAPTLVPGVWRRQITRSARPDLALPLPSLIVEILRPRDMPAGFAPAATTMANRTSWAYRSKALLNRSSRPATSIADATVQSDAAARVRRVVRRIRPTFASRTELSATRASPVRPSETISADSRVERNGTASRGMAA